MGGVRLNCWEIKKCERLIGGNKASEFGVCPAHQMNLLMD